MRIIERYINNSITKIFISTVSTFCFLYILIEVTGTLDEIIDRKIPMAILLQYYSAFFPIIIVQTSSFACLISILFTFSNLNNTNEIIVMRSSGMNFWKITKPALIFGIIVSILIFWVNERLVPKASIMTKQIRNENMILKVDRLKYKQKIRNLTFYGLKSRLYFIDSFDPKKSELHGITITGHDKNQNIKEKIVALRGTWTGIAWKFHQCQITFFDEKGKPEKIKIYPEKLMDIKETPKDFLRQRLDVNSMNIRQLMEYINKFKNSGAAKALNNLRVDFHQKIAFPFGNFVIVLIGLPFAMMIKSRKGATFASIGLAIAVGFLFYVTNAVTLALGKGGVLPPILSAWATPLIFAAVALIIIESDF